MDFYDEKPQKEKESKGLSSKINPGINMIHSKTYQVLSCKNYYAWTPVRNQQLIVPMKLSHKTKEVLLVALWLRLCLQFSFHDFNTQL